MLNGRDGRFARLQRGRASFQLLQDVGDSDAAGTHLGLTIDQVQGDGCD